MMSPAVVGRLLGLVLGVGWLAADCLAQKSPQLGYAFPPAIRVGTTADVQLGGYDFTPDLQWFIHHPNVTLLSAGKPGDYLITPPPYWTGPRAGVSSPLIAREVSARLEVKPDVAPGLIHFQVANANGVSQTGSFLVSPFDEILESRWRDDVQRLPSVPIGVSGRLSRLTEVDRYSFLADRDGLVRVEWHARRLGSDFNPMIQVHDARGQLVADHADTLGTDGTIGFKVTAGELYTIAIFDADFRGDASYVYHLAIEPGLKVHKTFPDRIVRGTQIIELTGLGIATGAPQWEIVEQKIDIAADTPLAPWVGNLSTSAGSIEYRLPLVEKMEAIVKGEPTEVVVGGLALSRAFASDAMEHRYRWRTELDSFWRFDVQALLGSSAMDVELNLLDASGKSVASNDDLAGTTDAGFSYRAAAGEYTLVVRRLSRAKSEVGNRYQLRVQPEATDYQLTFPASISLPLGGKSELVVQAQRLGGHNEEIALEVVGLPAGVTIGGDLKIPAGANQVKLILESAATGAVVAAPFQVVGKSKVGEVIMPRTAFAPAGSVRAPLQPEERQVSQSILAITMVPPFDIFLVDKTRQRDTPRGATCVAEMDIVRKDSFTGEILLEMAAQQSRYLCGSHGLSLLVSPNEKRVNYGTWMSEWLGTEFTMRMATHGVAQVADPQGNMRYVVKATDAPVTMIMEGALLKVSSLESNIEIGQGELRRIPIKISRSPKLQTEVLVDCEIPAEIRHLVTAKPLTLPAGAESGELELQIGSEPRLLGKWLLRIKAETRDPGHWPIRSYSDFTINIH